MSNSDDELVIVNAANQIVSSGQRYPLTEGKAAARVKSLNNPVRRNIHDSRHRSMTRAEHRILYGNS